MLKRLLPYQVLQRLVRRPPRPENPPSPDPPPVISSGPSPTDTGSRAIPVYIETLKNGFILLLKRVEPVLEGTPFRIPISLVNTIIDLAVTVSNNREDLKDTFQELSQHLDLVNNILPEAVTLEGKDRILKFYEGVKTEMEKIEALGTRRTFQQTLDSEQDTRMIETILRTIDRNLKSFQLEIIISLEKKMDDSKMDSALRILYEASAHDATHDAGDRYTHPMCHENTRTNILKNLRTWATAEDSKSILWMYGPAGTGKSAISQSMCRDLQQQGYLGASFFFKRGHPSRGSGLKLFPTIAYQLAVGSGVFKAALSRCLNEDPAIVHRSISIQLQKLIIGPSQEALLSARNTIIIIDGLDECENEGMQQDIVGSIGQLLPPNLSLHFLIASRQEPHIMQAFDQQRMPLDRLNVHGSLKDIRVYLLDEFKRIHMTHSTMAAIPGPWPTEEIINYLVEKSSGHFIYAATAIKFIKDNDFHPPDRLAMITQIQECDDMSPFSAIDALYIQILSSVPAQTQLTRILSIVAAGYKVDLIIIAQFLGTTVPKVYLTLRRLLSIFDIPHAQYLDVHHASFLDFLNDPKRAGQFYFGDANRHDLAIGVARNYSWSSTQPLTVFDMQFITTTYLSPQLSSQLLEHNSDHIFFTPHLYHLDTEVISKILAWLKTQQASATLVQHWTDYSFMHILEYILDERGISDRNTIMRERLELCLPNVISEEEFAKWKRYHVFKPLCSIEHIKSVASAELIRIINAYHVFTMHPLSPWVRISLWDICSLFCLTSKELLTIINPLQKLIESEHYEKMLLQSQICIMQPHTESFVPVEEFFPLYHFIVSMDLQIQSLYPEPTMKELVKLCLKNVQPCEGKKASNAFGSPYPWSCILRACPPSEELLDLLHPIIEETYAAYRHDQLEYEEYTEYNFRGEIHNILQWLETFSEPPFKMIEQMKTCFEMQKLDMLEYDDDIWKRWKAGTGW
ncbi:hypothetical protein R3P38DRAFT_3414049 [Favolaschia claudopus]|uniref:Nephrocystin 3-like N-terminal domain-containing protein n=1 Tax=Favolaschia claudopus TaxID=2862362 RepID=A0AAV9Z0M4_9AGAR